VVASAIGTIFSIDRNDRPIARIDPSQETTEFAGSPQEPIVRAARLDDVRKYVLDEMATPPLARQAKRRLLDEFERLGLDAVRRGEELVWPREAPTRMFGAIRAKANCLHCHANAKEGDLLAAFTYYLKVPVDQLNIRK
jgi:hypothetical protein